MAWKTVGLAIMLGALGNGIHHTYLRFSIGKHKPTTLDEHLEYKNKYIV